MAGMKAGVNRKPRKWTRVLLALAVLALAGIAVAQSQLADPPAAARHVAAAEVLAGDDLTAVAEGYLCKSPVGAGAYLAPYLVTLLAGTDTVQTFQAFDDLYYIGLKFVGTWVLVTDDGLVLFDAMFNEQQAREVVVAGLQQLGLDPKDLKHIIITHAHGD
ncbi:MAG TPA: MBL fold metallo-hydrolase, partial [Xanthomonadales bacterium]|nr:MBL fold metallo-hydrolase [Xanthomonadales bacterium]